METQDILNKIKDGVKVDMPKEDMILLILELSEEIKFCHLRIDRMAKNYKILEKTDDYISLGRLKESLSKIIRRLFKLENGKTNNF